MNSNEAESYLSDWHRSIYESFEDAVRTYQSQVAGCFFDPFKRMRAACISNLVCQNIVQRIPEGDGIHHEKSYERVMTHVHGRVILRYKKLTDNLTTRNIPTQLLMDFEHQRGHEQFDLFPPPVNLTAGYVLNPITMEIEVYITKPMGSCIEWFYPIDNREWQIVGADANARGEANEWVGQGQRERRDKKSK